jgi:gliding motility-associated-like protein
LLCFVLYAPAFAADDDDHYCTNLSFELGNFTNWVGYTWLYSTDVTSINTSKTKGIVTRRQTIMTDTTAYDPNTGYALKKIPSGYRYSARLGDAINTTTDSNPRCWEQSLRYTMTIDSANALLIMKFACVLEYASDHTAKMEPRFKVSLFDQNGDTIPDCANYDVYSSSSSVSGFKSYTPSGSTDPVMWRDWTTVGADLLAYMGQTITVEFMSADCTGRFHFGYAYFVADCKPMQIAVKYCSGDTAAVLTGPEGFESYTWTDTAGVVMGDEQSLTVEYPGEGAVYSCKMTSATGCTVTLQSTIVKYEPNADFSSYMIDCFSNTVQMVNKSTTTHGTLSYLWTFDDDSTSEERSPQHTFATSGLHEVTLSLENPPSTCTSTLTKEVESFSPPLVGIDGDSTYCPGLTTILTAVGAYQYIWNTGSTNTTMEVGDPGGTFWMLGYSSTGCVSDTSYITVSEEPGWTFTTAGDADFCNGDTSILSATGAASYLWSTGETTSSINVTSSGTYIIVGANARGCEKTDTFQVFVYPIPSTVFDLSSSTVDNRHNQLTCTIASETGVDYLWDWGDGSTSTGTPVQHTYSISNQTLEYMLTLAATSQYGCTDTASVSIEVVPFIPNVFSPNGDGVNDVFMSGLDLQVFDRNGILIYKGTDGWNGKYNGKEAAPDTYFYLIKYTDKDQQEQTRKGFITLVK